MQSSGVDAVESWRRLLFCLLGVVLAVVLTAGPAMGVAVGVGGSHGAQVLGAPADGNIAYLDDGQPRLGRRARRVKRHRQHGHHGRHGSHQSEDPQLPTSGHPTTRVQPSTNNYNIRTPALPGHIPFSTRPPVVTTALQQRMGTTTPPSRKLTTSLPRWVTTHYTGATFPTWTQGVGWRWRSSTWGPSSWAPVHTNPRRPYPPPPTRAVITVQVDPASNDNQPPGDSGGSISMHHVIIVSVSGAVLSILIMFGCVALVVCGRKPRTPPRETEKAIKMSALPPPNVYKRGLREIKEDKERKSSGSRHSGRRSSHKKHKSQRQSDQDMYSISDETLSEKTNHYEVACDAEQ